MTWDYIIVGAGSSGCALVSEIARTPSRPRILVLEAGEAARSLFARISAGVMRTFAKYDWGYQAEQDPSRNGVAERWLRGRVLGGSSTINGTMFARGAAHDFDRWNLLCGRPTDRSWAAAEITPIFRDMETSDRPGSLRGHDGPLYVRTVSRPHFLTRAFIESVTTCGYRFTDDYNGAMQEGVAYAQLSQRNGRRCSAADAFLRPLLASKRVTISLQSAVKCIEVKGSRAVGVGFSLHGQACRASARQVILCAGAIATPRLLMISGIGDPEELKCHGIAVRLPLPDVGQHLKEHPLLRLTFRASVPTYNLTHVILQKAGFASQFLMTGEGPLSNLFESVAFLRTSSAQSVPDIQLHFSAAGYIGGPGGTLELTPFPAVTVLLNKSYPQSTSRVRLSGASPGDPPLIEPRLLECEADVDTLVAGVRIVRTIMQCAPVSNWVTEEVRPGSAINSDSSLREYIRAHTTLASHPVGTCRMGRIAEAVVDPSLRVFGTDNLWIADASVMPDLISGNTNGPCMMIGSKLGREFARGDTVAQKADR